MLYSYTHFTECGFEFYSYVTDLSDTNLELEIKEKLHRTEKLEIELKNKENELAYMALSYTQKKEMLASLETKLDSLSKELNQDHQALTS